MLTPETIEKMNAMKLFGLVSAFETQLSSSEYKELSFEERVGLLVDAEWTAREQRKLSRRLRAAKLRYPACLENVNFQAPRGLNREQILSLGNCRFVGERHNLLITGPTGIGKSFLACAFVERACRRGFTGCYVRAPRLLHELAVARGDGSYARLLTKLAKLDLLAIDDWLLHPLKESERRDLMEVIEDRAERGSTLIATQIPLKQWHEAIGDPNQADAICDRILHSAHRITWTIGYFTTWYDQYYTSEKLLVTFFFATAFFTEFGIIPLLQARQGPKLRAAQMVVVLANVTWYMAALDAMLYDLNRPGFSGDCFS